jgi:hypothetical protein
VKEFSPERSLLSLQYASLPGVKNVGKECDAGAEAARSTDHTATTANAIARTVGG